MSKLLGLDGFGIKLAELRRLRCSIKVHVRLRAFDATAAVARLAVAERHPFLRRRATRWVRRLKAAFPVSAWKVRLGNREMPVALDGRIEPRHVSRLVRQAGVETVTITSIPGCRRRRAGAVKGWWFCVRALVAIQIEGQRVGLQSVEDRFVLVRARSAEEARRRLRRQWREYAKPYLNHLGELVRWRLEKVTDTYETVESELDPNGVEVYSRLSNRRMRNEFVWLGR